MTTKLRPHSRLMILALVVTVLNAGLAAFSLSSGRTNASEPELTTGPGDVNCDGFIGIEDSLRLARILAGLHTATCPAVAPTETSTSTPQPHDFGYGECAGGNCGLPPLLVICAPDGWFVDVGRDYPNPGWPTSEVLRASDASGVC